MPRLPDLPDGGEPERGVALDTFGPWPWWVGPAGIALGLALGVMGDLGVGIVGAVAGASLTHPPPAVNIVGSVVFDLGFVAAAVYVASRLGVLQLAQFGFRRAPLVRVLWMLPAVAVVYYVGTALYASALSLHGREQLPTGLGSPNDTAAMIGVGVFVTVLAPIFEEFFFRGFLFGALRSWLASRSWGVWGAAGITGVCFGAAHAGSAAAKYLVPLGFLGFLLCVLRWRTGSLYPGMVLHSVNNSLAFGIDELHWSTAKVLLMAIGALAAIALIAGPLGWREPAVAVDGSGSGGGPPPAPAAAGSVAPPGR